MKKFSLLLIFILAVFGALLLFKPALAAITYQLKNPLEALLGSSPTRESILTIIGTAIKIAISMSGAFALILFIWGGFLWITSRGDSGQITQGKQVLVWTSVGLIIILFSFVIVDFVIFALTGQLTTPGTYTPPPMADTCPSPAKCFEKSAATKCEDLGSGIITPATSGACKASEAANPGKSFLCCQEPVDTCAGFGTCQEKTSPTETCETLATPKDTVIGKECAKSAVVAGKTSADFLCCKDRPIVDCDGDCLFYNGTDWTAQKALFMSSYSGIYDDCEFFTPGKYANCAAKDPRNNLCCKLATVKPECKALASMGGATSVECVELSCSDPGSGSYGYNTCSAEFTCNTYGCAGNTICLYRNPTNLSEILCGGKFWCCYSPASADCRGLGSCP